MIRFVLLTLIVGIGAAVTLSVAEAKGPPARVTISGGNLRSEVEIARPDLVPIDSVGYWEDTGGVPYARTADIAGQTPYLVTIYELVTGEDPQLFLSGNYFPANTGHPDLYEESGSLFKVQPVFGALLDSRIKSALSVANLPSSGGPPAGGDANGWAYALLAAGVLFLFTSMATVAYSRRN